MTMNAEAWQCITAAIIGGFVSVMLWQTLSHRLPKK